jgi:IMP dehydrogenase
MKTVETLKLTPVWVDPAHLASTARILMEGHRSRALAVLESGELVGVVTAEHLANAPEYATVHSVMEQPRLVVQDELSVREVAELFVAEGVDFAPVLHKGRFTGIVTAMMLLGELSRSWDPLTNLSWSDFLREWGVDNLKKGREVTILFLDLDDFGQYNKRYGHIVGDRVLRQFAEVLSQSVDPERDVLVRYGGDEFAIGTLRSRPEAQGLAETIKRKLADSKIGEGEEQVTFCVGVFGGKRSRERENTHYAATLDNLINLASRECMAQKRWADETDADARQEAPAPAPKEEAPEQGAPKEENPTAAPQEEPNSPAPLPPVNVIGVHVDEHSPGSLTQVILNVGEEVVSGVSARTGRSVMESVAIATGKALERGFAGHAVRIEEIRMAEGAERQRLVSVAGQVSDGQRTVEMGGVARVGHDLYATVAEATVKAFLSAFAEEHANAT